jgi:hypothetical protein
MTSLFLAIIGLTLLFGSTLKLAVCVHEDEQNRGSFL